MTTPPFEPPPGEQPPPAPAEAGQPLCPNCGAPHDALQEYCLECGRRLVPLAGTTTTRDVWTRESPIWLWLALGALLLVALAAGAIVALAATDDDDGGAVSAATTTVPSGPVTIPTDPGTITIDTLTSPTLTVVPTVPTTTTLPTTTVATTTSPTTTTAGGIIEWPAGEDGYTVVLRSTPTSQGRGAAESTAQQARSSGLPEVGILESSDFSSLNPGYYVVFTGVYDTQNEAEAALPRARSAGFSTAYVREVRD